MSICLSKTPCVQVDTTVLQPWLLFIINLAFRRSPALIKQILVNMQGKSENCRFPWVGINGSFPAPGWIQATLITIFFKLSWAGSSSLVLQVPSLPVVSSGHSKSPGRSKSLGRSKAHSRSKSPGRSKSPDRSKSPGRPTCRLNLTL